MTSHGEPPRLRDGGPLSKVMASAAEDEPTAAELKAIAAGLPLVQPPPMGTTAGAVVKMKAAAALATALLGVGALVGLALWAHSQSEREQEREQAEAPPAATSVVPLQSVPVLEAPPPAPQPVPPAPVAPPLPPLETDPGANDAKSPPNRQTARRTAARDAGSEELLLLNEAFLALRRADARGALALATRHESVFPQGAFVQERELILIEALVEIGRLEEAKNRGMAFLTAFPDSSHRLRLEELLLRKADGG